ncbi:MAG: hypothetical protein ACKOZV_17790, partial [Bacteroidota bacterium]
MIKRLIQILVLALILQLLSCGRSGSVRPVKFIAYVGFNYLNTDKDSLNGYADSLYLVALNTYLDRINQQENLFEYRLKAFQCDYKPDTIPSIYRGIVSDTNIVLVIDNTWGKYIREASSIIRDKIPVISLSADQNRENFGGNAVFLGGTTDGFLAKFSPAGVRQWATYFGGPSVDYIYSVKVNNAGEPYVVGRTTSNSGVATSGAHDASFNGAADAFIAKFNSNGTLRWATYYGGSGDDLAYSLAVSSDGLSLYVAGQTKSSTGISTPSAHDPTYSADFDAFLVKFDSAGVRQWGTYYGDTGKDEYDGVALDNATGYVYLSGCTNSTSSISTLAFPYGGGVDAFLVSFDGNGTRMWGRYFGGSLDDCGL